MSVTKNTNKSSCEQHEANRHSWNAATTQHRSHKPDLVQSYTQGQRNNLFAEDMQLLVNSPSKLSSSSASMPSLEGQNVLHLQCNDGQDTISIAKWLHPHTVVGVDISDTAINFAEELKSSLENDSCEADQEVQFVRSDVLDYLHNPENEHKFDVVFSSYGTVCWLSDLTAWANGIAKVLRPGSGRLVLIDFHPTATAIDALSHRITDPCMGGVELPQEQGVGDYVGNDFGGNFSNTHASFEYVWSIGDIVTAILSAKLQLTSLTEYPYVNGWQMWKGMTDVSIPSSGSNPSGGGACTSGNGDHAETSPTAGGGAPQTSRYGPPEGMPSIPLMYSITAVAL